MKSPLRVLSVNEKEFSNLCQLGKKYQFNGIVVNSIEQQELAKVSNLTPFYKIEEPEEVSSSGVFFISKLFCNDLKEVLRAQKKLKIDLLLEEMAILENRCKNKQILYYVNEPIEERYYKELQRHLAPSMSLIIPISFKSAFSAIPSLSLHAHEAPLYLPEFIDRLRGESAVVTILDKVAPEGFVEAHLAMIAESLLQGRSPYDTFSAWIKKTKPYLEAPHLEWIEKLSKSYPKLLFLEKAKNKDPLLAEELRTLVDILILEWKSWQKGLEKAALADNFHEERAHFWRQIQGFILFFQQRAKEALMAHQVSLPPYFLQEH